MIVTRTRAGPPSWVTGLRKYQKELANPGIHDGHNYIIVAPTGSGKTRVAAYIIYNRLLEQVEPILWEDPTFVCAASLLMP